MRSQTCRRLTPIGEPMETDKGTVTPVRCEECHGEFLIVRPQRGPGRMIPFAEGHVLTALKGVAA
jgi:hypothetical protein